MNLLPFRLGKSGAEIFNLQIGGYSAIKNRDTWEMLPSTRLRLLKERCID